MLLYCMYYLIVCLVVVLCACTWLFVLLLYCKRSGTHIQYNNRTNNQVHTYNTTRQTSRYMHTIQQDKQSGTYIQYNRTKLYCMCVADCLSCCCIVCVFLMVCVVVVLYLCTWLFVMLLYCMYYTIQQQDKQSGTHIQYNNKTNNQVHTYNTPTRQTIRYILTIQQQDKQSGAHIQCLSCCCIVCM
jgi:Flp pilus assembly protein TadB